MSDWHAQKIPHLLHEFKTDLERGLSNAEAKTQRLKYGSNEIDSPREPSLPLLFLKQISSITVLLLAVTGVALLYSQHAMREVVAIFAILGFHVLWRFAQAAKARHQLQSISKHSEVHVSLIRDGAVTQISPNEVVPGDLIILNEGDFIAADARIVEADSLIVDETSLFHAATSVRKNAEDGPEGVVVPPEKQRNMIFAGTHVVEGHGRAVVVKTGKELELHNPNRRTPRPLDLPPEAEMQMGVVYNYFKYVGLIVAGIVIGIAWVFHRTDVRADWPELLFLGLGFAIASVPEGIASTTRAILAQNAHKLLQKGVAIHRLATLEKLSNLTAICVDEVGVFTKEELTLSHAFVDEQLIERTTWEKWLNELEELPGEEREETIPVPSPQSQVPLGFPLLILAASRCAAGRQYQHGNATGKYIHDALKQIAVRIGFDLERYDAELPLIDELPETSTHPYKGFVFETDGGKHLRVIFGEPEAVLNTCQSVQSEGTTHEMKSDQEQLIWQAIQHLHNKNAQVFGVAHRTSEASQSSQEIGHNATFLGLVAFAPFNDENAEETVGSCMDAGIKVVMITDKDRQTAFELAKELGMTQDRNAVAEKPDLDKLGGGDYGSIVDRFLVYCRPSVEQKLSIVQYLKRHEYSLGFLGRSPKDLRVMKAADVSFASTSHAAQVVQRNAGCLMLRDGFPVIEVLLNHTREAYSNLRSSMRWLISCALAQLITLVVGFCLHQLYGFPMPLTLQQIIWIHLLVNLVPLTWLGHDQIQGHLTYNRSQKILPFLYKSYRSDILLRSLVIGLMTIVSFVVTLEATSENPEKTQMVAQTAACTTLIFTQLISNFQCRRHFWESLIQRITANLPLLITVLVCMGLHLATVYLEPAGQIFGMASLTLREWQWIGSFCILALLPLNLATGKR